MIGELYCRTFCTVLGASTSYMLVAPACLPWGTTSPISIPCFICLSTSFRPHIRKKKCTGISSVSIQLWGGNKHRVLSRSCSQPMGKRRQVRQPGWGALGHCSPGEGTSARFLRPPNSCCNGICNAALHVENHEGMEGPKKANQVTKDAKESKKIQLCRIVTGLSHDPRKPVYKGQWKALGTWERF